MVPDKIVSLPDMSMDDIYCAPPMATYYESLSFEDDKKLYTYIQQALEQALNGDDSFVETDIDLLKDEDWFLRIAHMVLYDHPKYGSFWSTCHVEILNRTQVRVPIESDSPDFVPDSVYQNQLVSLEGDTDLETAWNVFSFLTEHITYDITFGEHSNDDYGVMVNRTACCQGISFAYKRFLDLAQIPCVVITGYTELGEYHMINAISIDHTWYYCDVTSALNSDSSRGFCMNKNDVMSVMKTVKYVPYLRNL